MGIEYSLRFTAPSEEVVAEAVGCLQGVVESPFEPAGPGTRFDLGGGEATAIVEPGGLYFCDHCGGSGRAFLGQVVARLVSVFGSVTIEEL
jgi:hypothetical protein